MLSCCIALWSVIAACSARADGEFAVGGCTVRWTDRMLAVGNRLFERSYISLGGRLQTVSFKSSAGSEWQTNRYETVGGDVLAVSAMRAKWSPVGAEGVRLEVVSGGLKTRLDVYPDVPGVISQVPTDEMPVRVRDLERDFDARQNWKKTLADALARSDALTYGNRHVKMTSTVCIDQTDIRDSFISSDERLLARNDWPFTVSATSVDFRDLMTGAGLLYVRMAPMPLSRPSAADDLIVDGGHGTVAPLANGYPLAELVYEGGVAGRQRAVVAFQRALRPYRQGRDGLFLSNTWGGGHADSRICQDFLLNEIDAGARIGVDVIQIDDGWEQGRTTTSQRAAKKGREKVWNGYWASDPDFWKEDRGRFPDGLSFLVGKAAEKGMRFGLWFGPDSSDDAANWERDADCLLDFHRRLGIDFFKLDSLKLRTPLALARNRRMFDKMLGESAGRMVFDLDCTAEVRPGYFGLLDIGPLFVENRYANLRAYWPHHTLRNLWDLSHHVDPVRLRFEFNNPDVSGAVYGEDPLAPARYRPDALFATVMTASPLAWMELSEVSDRSVAALAPLVARWKEERARWHGGVIHPVGGRPDGVAWTGFVSEAPDGRGGYALLFRERNRKPSFALDLDEVCGVTSSGPVEVIGGRGDASLAAGVLSVTVREELDYIWVKY